MVFAQAEFILRPKNPFYLGLFAEYALGKDLSIASFGLDTGATLYEGYLIFAQGRLSASIGFSASVLEIEESDFGDFDTGIGLRAGLQAEIALSEKFSFSVGLEGRYVDFEWSGTVLSEDVAATGTGLAVSASLNYSF